MPRAYTSTERSGSADILVPSEGGGKKMKKRLTIGFNVLSHLYSSRPTAATRAGGGKGRKRGNGRSRLITLSCVTRRPEGGGKKGEREKKKKPVRLS